MTRGVRAVAVSCAAILAMLGSSNRCLAQQFHLPVDFGQGLVIHADAPRTPYVFQTTVAPSIDWGNFRLSAALSPIDLNPKWDVGVGGQLSALFPVLVHDLGLRITGEGLYLPRTSAALISAGIAADVFGLLRLGVWPAYATGEKRVLLRTTIGFDIVNLIRIAGGPSETEFKTQAPRPSPPAERSLTTDRYGLLRDGLRSRVLGILPQSDMTASVCWIDAHRAALLGAPTVEQLKEQVAQAAQGQLARQIDATLEANARTDGADPRAETAALVTGLVAASAEAHAALSFSCGQQ